jgi:hypothetical protein
LSLEVEAQLLIQFPLCRFLPENGAESKAQITEHDAPPYAVSSTWATANVSLFQASFSTSRRRHPLLVSS